MRGMILLCLVLLPVLAQAQASSATEPQPPPSSANLRAQQAVVPEPPGATQYAMGAGGTPVKSTAPVVTRTVEVDLSPREFAAQPAVTNVVVRAMVDIYGFPRNLAVTQSAGAFLDKKAIAAVRKYHFHPATLDNQPVNATVLITIKIQKP